MSERNLGVVNNVLGIEANGNPGDVITRDAGLGVGWAPAAGIAGIQAQNAGVPLAGGPWQTLDALTGVLADGGGGVLQYTLSASAVQLFPNSPPAVPSAFDDEFTTPALAAIWTVDDNPTAAGGVVANDLDQTWLSYSTPGAAANNVLTISQALGAAGNAGTPITVTVRVALSILDPTAATTGRVTVAVGTLRPILTGSFVALLWQNNAQTGLQLQRYDGAAVNTTLPIGANAIYLHFQRDAANNMRLWFSLDGIGWVQFDNVVRNWNAAFLQVQVDGRTVGVGNPCWGRIDWVRVNDARFTQPI